MHLHVLVNIACLCIRTALSPGFVELSLKFHFISWVWISLPQQDPCKKCSDW